MVNVATQRRLVLDDMSHVRLAACRVGNPFFVRADVDGAYARTVFCGRGTLFVARPDTARAGWRVHFAFFFTAGQHGARFALLPHADEHADARSARRHAENMAARLHNGTWQQALGLFVARRPRAVA
ncbi:hypothetical protein [Streptomyces melanogenes]|uniref:hypothetical protein n=1 Tax=Streptomyces melanogenes TaxID=67326 RepID=UPI00167E304D|nr:hypothetical protein [Streptomyces melanogenes]GGP86324.1 hypothetical protein GCM10010278_75910 [Streptomyces melanogenes]